MASKWYYRVGDEKQGPIESKALKLLAEVGQITPNTLVQKEGAKSWAEASRVNGLFEPKQSDSVTAPPVLNNSNQDEAPDIPVATEYAYKVAPDAPLMPQGQEGTTVTVNVDNESHKRQRKSTLPLIFTVVGIFVVLGLGSVFYYHFETKTTIPIQGSAQAPNPKQTPSTLKSKPTPPEELVFLGIRSYSDGSKSRTRLANNKVQMRITEVWLAKSEETVDGIAIPPEFAIHVLLETENLNTNDEFILNRESAVRFDTDSLNPYAPLARNGTDQFLTLTEALSTRTIPAGGKVVEKLSFTMDSDQLEDFKLAVPLAWFRQTGYMGYSIPNVMVGHDSAEVTVAQTPDSPLADPANSIEENSDNAIRSQTTPETPVSDKAAAGEESVKKKNGQLPPPPDFGIPTKPTGKNGDQPEDIKSLQNSIKSSVNSTNTNQEVEDERPANSAEPPPSAEPIFK